MFAHSSNCLEVNVKVGLVVLQERGIWQQCSYPYVGEQMFLVRTKQEVCGIRCTCFLRGAGWLPMETPPLSDDGNKDKQFYP